MRAASDISFPPDTSETLGGCMRLMKFALVVVTLAAAAALGVHAQADPNSGTWKLNLTKSKYNAGAAPKSLTTVIEASAQSIKVTATSVQADGSTRNIAYMATFDGKDAVVTGTPDYDAISSKRTGSSIDSTRKKGGKAVQTVHSTISADGKSRTVTTTGTNAGGAKVDNVQVYDKQ